MTYKGRDYPFTFRAGGRFRNVDTEMTTMELCGQVINLKTWKTLTAKVEEIEGSVSGGGSRVTIKNQNGVVVNVVSPIKGRKFDLTVRAWTYSLKK